MPVEMPSAHCNHCIRRLPTQKVGFVVNEVSGDITVQVAVPGSYVLQLLAMDVYGCSVV
jgi:hypothetical protein